MFENTFAWYVGYSAARRMILENMFPSMSSMYRCTNAKTAKNISTIGEHCCYTGRRGTMTALDKTTHTTAPTSALYVDEDSRRRIPVLHTLYCMKVWCMTARDVVGCLPPRIAYECTVRCGIRNPVNNKAKNGNTMQSMAGYMVQTNVQKVLLMMCLTFPQKTKYIPALLHVAALRHIATVISFLILKECMVSRQVGHVGCVPGTSAIMRFSNIIWIIMIK